MSYLESPEQPDDAWGICATPMVQDNNYLYGLAHLKNGDTYAGYDPNWDTIIQKIDKNTMIVVDTLTLTTTLFGPYEGATYSREFGYGMDIDIDGYLYVFTYNPTSYNASLTSIIYGTRIHKINTSTLTEVSISSNFAFSTSSYVRCLDHDGCKYIAVVSYAGRGDDICLFDRTTLNLVTTITGIFDDDGSISRTSWNIDNFGVGINNDIWCIDNDLTATPTRGAHLHKIRWDRTGLLGIDHYLSVLLCPGNVWGDYGSYNCVTYNNSDNTLIVGSSKQEEGWRKLDYNDCSLIATLTGAHVVSTPNEYTFTGNGYSKSIPSDNIYADNNLDIAQALSWADGTYWSGGGYWLGTGPLLTGPWTYGIEESGNYQVYLTGVVGSSNSLQSGGDTSIPAGNFYFKKNGILVYTIPYAASSGQNGCDISDSFSISLARGDVLELTSQNAVLPWYLISSLVRSSSLDSNTVTLTKTINTVDSDISLPSACSFGPLTISGPPYFCSNTWNGHDVPGIAITEEGWYELDFQFSWTFSGSSPKPSFNITQGVVNSSGPTFEGGYLYFMPHLSRIISTSSGSYPTMKLVFYAPDTSSGITRNIDFSVNWALRSTASYTIDATIKKWTPDPADTVVLSYNNELVNDASIALSDYTQHIFDQTYTSESNNYLIVPSVHESMFQKFNLTNLTIEQDYTSMFFPVNTFQSGRIFGLYGLWDSATQSFLCVDNQAAQGIPYEGEVPVNRYERYIFDSIVSIIRQPIIWIS